MSPTKAGASRPFACRDVPATLSRRNRVTVTLSRRNRGGGGWAGAVERGEESLTGTISVSSAREGRLESLPHTGVTRSVPPYLLSPFTFAQVSFRVTVRLKTSLSGVESRSTVK